MYDTGGPAGAAAVVVESVEVVPYCEAAGEASVVVTAPVSVLVEDAPVPVEVEVEPVVGSVLVVEPVKTLTTPPSGSLGSATAPEARTPSKSRAANPATSLAVWPCHFDPLPPISLSSLVTTVRASPDR
jgi:hypothetical protein